MEARFNILRICTGLVAFIFLAFSVDAFACKCAHDPSVRESFQSSDLVLHGTAVRADTVFFPQTITETDVASAREKLKGDSQMLRLFETTPVLRVELEVLEGYKGENRRNVVIYTPLRSATCGYKFKEGMAYIVYASKRIFLPGIFGLEPGTVGVREMSGFWTTHCTRTAPYTKSEADELRTLKS